MSVPRGGRCAKSNDTHYSQRGEDEEQEEEQEEEQGANSSSFGSRQKNSAREANTQEEAMG